MVGLKSLRLPEKLRVHCWRVWKFREYCHYRDNGFLLPKAKLEVGHLHCSDHSAPFIKAVEPWGIRLLYKINETYFFCPVICSRRENHTSWAVVISHIFCVPGDTALSWQVTSSSFIRVLSWNCLYMKTETDYLIALPGSIHGVVLFISIIYQRFY